MTKTRRLPPLPDERPAARAPLPEWQPSRRQHTPHLGRLAWQGIRLGLLLSAFAALLGAGALLGVYAYYAADLPMSHELPDRASTFKSTRILDRHGRPLYEIIDPLGGRRTPVRYDELPATLIQATVATEDPTFFTNPGFSLRDIARALYIDLRYGAIVQGASGITQQLVKNTFLTPERALSRKIREAILAYEITQRYTKAEILALYLNEVYLGNLAYGVGAAAETFFGKSVSELTLAESALLAGLIQSPPLYDPYLDPQAARERRAIVLGLMQERGYITAEERVRASQEPLGVKPPVIAMKAPHFVAEVQLELLSRYGKEEVYRGGWRVYTTLDLELQYLAEEIAREKLVLLRDKGATNAALVALNPSNGDVLAMLGSADFWRQESGQFNVATQGKRQPGSLIKPFVYLAALERGWTPATMMMDVEQDFPDGLNPPYRPRNYDEQEWGAISLRTALAASRNVPAVSTLYQVGLPSLLEVTRRLGIRSLDRADYGLSLALGGGEVTLLEVTGAYGALANGGRQVTPRTLLYIEDNAGRTVLPKSAPEMPAVMDPRHAYLLTHILADREARVRAFGRNSALELSFPAAVKTGTTDDYRDSWTVGYTSDLVVGVWVGNNDNSPMDRLSGARGAALIWHDVMERALAAQPPEALVRPEGLVALEICPISGQLRTNDCPPSVKELFLAEHTPGICTVHRRLKICRITGKLATEFCPVIAMEERVYEDYGVAWDAWANERHIPLPPRETCDLHTGPTYVRLEVPQGPISGLVDVRGHTEMPGFSHYVVEYGLGEDPHGWRRITPEIHGPVYGGVLCRWDTRELERRIYTLRVVVYDRYGHSQEARAVVEVRN